MDLSELFAKFEADQAAPLTVQAIETLEDKRLDSWLWARACRLAGHAERERLLAMSPGVRAYYLTRDFEWEVGNGGLGQYVSNAVNNTGTNFDLIAEGYDLMGLSDRAALVRTVGAQVAPYAHMYLDDWEGEDPPEDDQHDEALCELSDDRRLAYVRKHAKEFAI